MSRTSTIRDALLAPIEHLLLSIAIPPHAKLSHVQDEKGIVGSLCGKESVLALSAIPSSKLRRDEDNWNSRCEVHLQAWAHGKFSPDVLRSSRGNRLLLPPDSRCRLHSPQPEVGLVRLEQHVRF